jgi:type I restriction enzyme R subunit
VNSHGRDARAPFASAHFFNPFDDVHEHWHNLPHWQQDGVWQFVTWRLADSLPKSKLDEWNREKAVWLKHHPRPWGKETAQAYQQLFGVRIDEWLDAGHGSCVLKFGECGKIVAKALHHFIGERYELNGFVVMPNHVHVLFRPLTCHALEDIVHSWKCFTGREINKAIHRTGKLWQEDYWDRMIRNEAHFDACRKYIAGNPVRAKLNATEYILFLHQQT